MAKTRKQKEDLVKVYEDFIENSKAIYLANAKLNGNEVVDLKKELTEVDSKITVLKNTLFNIALKNKLGIDLDLEGQNTIFFCQDDVVVAAKKLVELKKDERAEIKYCVFEGEVVDPSKIVDISNLESREVLLSKLVFVVNEPTSRLARSLNQSITKVCYALNALKEQKEKGS